METSCEDVLKKQLPANCTYFIFISGILAGNTVAAKFTNCWL